MKMSKGYNCPNCGAPASRVFCAYCGTPLYTEADVFDVMKGRLSHLWVEDEEGQVYLLDIRVEGVEYDGSSTVLYTWDGLENRVNDLGVVIRAKPVELDWSAWKEWLDRRSEEGR